jgi:ABC-type dipeptide/oligopeptide/nickel transport system ATPase component
VPSLNAIPPGCPFHPRCEHALRGVCDEGGPPPLIPLENGSRGAACLRLKEIHPDLAKAGTAGSPPPA